MSDETEATEEPLSLNEANLAQLASRHAPDLFLTDLILKAEPSRGLAIGLLVNGMVVLGRLASPMEIATEIDTATTNVLSVAERPKDTSEQQWSEIREQARTAEAEPTQRHLDAVAELDDKLEPYTGEDGIDFSKLPPDLARELIDAGNRSHLTLVEASINAPGQPGKISLDVLRVARDQVAAWWPLRVSEQGNSETVLWRIDGKGAHDPPPPDPAPVE